MVLPSRLNVQFSKFVDGNSCRPARSSGLVDSVGRGLSAVIKPHCRRPYPEHWLRVGVHVLLRRVEEPHWTNIVPASSGLITNSWRVDPMHQSISSR